MDDRIPLDDWEWDEEPMSMLENSFIVHWDQLCALAYGDEDSIDPKFEPLTKSPFCGCEVCSTRETFALLLPAFIDMFEKGQIRRVKEDSDDVLMVPDSGGLESAREDGSA